MLIPTGLTGSKDLTDIYKVMLLHLHRIYSLQVVGLENFL